MRIRPLYLLPPLLAGAIGCAGHGGHVREGIAEGRAQMERMRSAADYDIALQQVRSGRLEEALTTTGRVCAREPDVPLGHLLRGRVLLELGRPAEALASFERACALDPEAARPHYFRGLALEEVGRLDDAAAAFERAARLEPERVESVLAASEVLADLGRTGEARRLLVELGGTHPGVRQLQGHLALVEGDTEAARGFFEQALLLDPDDDALREDLARVLLAEGRLGEPAAHLRPLVAGDPLALADLALLLGWILLRTNDPAGARSVLLPFLEGEEADPEAIAALLDAAASLEDDGLLVRAGRRLASLAPGDPRGPLALAFACVLRADSVGAAAALRDARRLGCEEEAARTLEDWIGRLSS